MESSSQNILKQQDNIFFRCVQDCHEPIMITDTRGHLIYVNTAWCQTYGFSPEEALGKTPRMLRSQYQSTDFYKKLWSQILNPQIGSWRGELINLAKNGDEVPVLLNITPYKNNDGETLGYMGLAMDLRRQKSLEDQVAQQDRLATIGELTSGLAHEIGTPVGVIRGRAEMMQMQLEDESPMQKSLSIIIKQADRISTLISSLLRLSRKTANDPLVNIDIREVIVEVEELLVQRLRKFNIQLINEIPEQFLAFADRNKVEQVLLNLMVNSIHAITSRSEKNPDCLKSITVRGCLNDDDQVELQVSDTGGGIPSDILEKIFHPFFTTKPTSQGTGLGLAIVYRIMDELGGHIRVDSDVENGSTSFYLTLQKPKTQ